MTNTKITAESFLDSKELREQAMERVEVLDKVKQLFLLPELECMITSQVAKYFEVDESVIRQQYVRNKDEFDSDGTCTKSSTYFKNLCVTSCHTQKMAQQRGFIEMDLGNGTKIIIPNGKVKCYPKRAVLRMGMLLRDSRVAKEIRTQLLNTFEHATVEQRTYEINKERKLRDDIWDAWGADDIDEVMKASAALDGYRKRHIAALEKKNADLERKNEEISSDNKALTAENDIYAKDVLKWTDRSSANRAVKVMANMCFKGDYGCIWNTIYKELVYKYGIDVKRRASGDKRKKSLISYIRNDEWTYLFKVIAALCNQNNIKIKNLFADAKIDISNLDLTDKQLANTSA